MEWGGDILLPSRLGGGERRELAQRDPRIRILGPHITAVGMSLCTNPPKFHPNRTAHGRKMTSCRFSTWRMSAILDFSSPIMGSFKSPCRTSYIVNCLVFEKIVFLCTHFCDSQRTDNRRTARDRQAVADMAAPFAPPNFFDHTSYKPCAFTSINKL